MCPCKIGVERVLPGVGFDSLSTAHPEGKALAPLPYGLRSPSTAIRVYSNRTPTIYEPCNSNNKLWRPWLVKGWWRYLRGPSQLLPFSSLPPNCFLCRHPGNKLLIHHRARPPSCDTVHGTRRKKVALLRNGVERGVERGYKLFMSKHSSCSLFLRNTLPSFTLCAWV